MKAQVSQVTWDVYALSTDPTQTQESPRTSSPAMGAQVEFSIGSGSVATPTAWANENGDATTLYWAAEPKKMPGIQYLQRPTFLLPSAP